jgi:hypothetical protein
MSKGVKMTTYKSQFFNAKIRVATSVLSLASLCAVGFTSPSYAASPASDSFRDGNLKSCVIQTYNNLNGTKLTKLTVKQLATLTSLSCRNMNISDASGLERLTKLTSLNLSGNRLATIDLTKNTKLTNLDLRFNILRSLNLDKQTKLNTLYINSNKLSSLDIRKNKELAKFRADNIILDTNAVASQAGSIYTLDLSSIKFFNLPTHLYFNDAYDYNNDVKLLATKDKNALAYMMNTGSGFGYNIGGAYRIRLPAAKNVSMNIVATQLAKIYKTHAKTYIQLVIYLSKYGVTEPQVASAMRQAGITYDKAALYSDLSRLMGYFAGVNARG